MRQLTLRPKAQADIEAIIDYLLVERPPSAKGFVNILQNTFDLLAENPKIGATRQYSQKALSGMRMFPIKQFSAYLIFYLHDDQTLDVVRVLHGSKEISALFNE